MRRVLALLALGSLAACLQIGTPQDPEESTAGSSGSSGSAGSGMVRASGIHCGVDPSSGISLCLGISTCPSVRVDPDQFPECGYRISGSAIDLECLCGDSLCPMGPAVSCLDARNLLSEQSALGVCASVADGRCKVVQR